MAEGRAAGRRTRGRLLVAAGALAAGLVALALAALWVVHSPAVERAVRARALPAASQALGRAVEVGRIRFGLLPPRVTLEGLTVAGVDSGPPLLRARRATASVELWPLVRSRGRDVRLKHVAVEQPTVHLARDRQGRWSFHGLFPAETERAVRLDRLELRDGTLRVSEPGFETPVPLGDVDLALSGFGPDGKSAVEIRAALGGERQNLTASLVFDRRTDPARLEGSLSIARAPLAPLRPLLPEPLAAAVEKGAVDVHAAFGTEHAQWVALATVRTEGLSLRGQAVEARAGLALRVDPAHPERATARVQGIHLSGPGLDLRGQAQLRARPLRATFALEGRELDLAALLRAVPALPAREGAPALPPSLRARLRAARASGTVSLDKVRAGKLEASALEARAELHQGRLTLPSARARLYRGTLVADGSSADLSQERPAWTLRARLDGVQIGEALRAVSGAAPVEGRLSGSAHLAGAGFAWGEVRAHVTGSGSIALQGGRLAGIDLAQSLSGPLAQGLRLAGIAPRARSLPRIAGGTALDDLEGTLRIEGGWLRFSSLRLRSEAGAVHLTGAVALDGRLDLEGEALLEPALVSRVARTWRPSSALPVPIALRGTLAQPDLAAGPPAEIAARVAADAQHPIRERAERAGRRAGQALRRHVGGSGDGSRNR